MKSGSQQQRRVFEFLRGKYRSQEPFTKAELEAHVGWDPAKGTFRTYFSKQYGDLLIKIGDSYGVSHVFRRYNTWEKFRDEVLTQKRRLKQEYRPSCYENVVIFEFFMPLRNEEYLREALDSLFFKDSIKFRLEAADENAIEKAFPKNPNEGADAHIERLCRWLAGKFVGYSIQLVSGRFRVGGLKSRSEVFSINARSAEPYLIDETTAIVRFVIPCGDESGGWGGLRGDDSVLPLKADRNAEIEAKRIRWFFDALFVCSILEVVNAEDQIWLLESGMRNRLHIWKSREPA